MAAAKRRSVPELKALFELCRANGIVRFHEEGFEVLFGPLPEVVTTKKNGSDPLRTRREHYETMFARPVTDKELEHLP